MTQPLLGDEADHAAEMERALRRQPQSPSEFQAPRPQHSSSPRPNIAEETNPIHHKDFPPQREQRLFGPHSEDAKVAARLRRDQITAVLRDVNRGACLTDDAMLYVAEIVPHIAIACGQRAFWFVLEEWIEANAPQASRNAVAEIVNDILQDPPRYNSVAIGKRLRVTLEQYDRLRLTHIRPLGMSRKKLDEHLAKRKAMRVKLKRHVSRETKTPRELSVARVKPWTVPGAQCGSRTAFFALPKEVREALLARAREGVGRRP